MDERILRILDAYHRNGPVTLRQIQQDTNIPRSTIHELHQELPEITCLPLLDTNKCIHFFGICQEPVDSIFVNNVQKLGDGRYFIEFICFSQAQQEAIQQEVDFDQLLMVQETIKKEDAHLSCPHSGQQYF